MGRRASEHARSHGRGASIHALSGRTIDPQWANTGFSQVRDLTHVPVHSGSPEVCTLMLLMAKAVCMAMKAGSNRRLSLSAKREKCVSLPI